MNSEDLLDSGVEVAVFFLGISFTGFDVISGHDGSFAVTAHTVAKKDMLVRTLRNSKSTHMSSPWLWQPVSVAGYSSVLVMEVWT